MAADTDSNDEVSLDIGLGGEILATISYSSLAIVGTVGNIMLILVIYRTPSLKTVCGALISNVAVADLMVTVIVMPLVVFSLVEGILGHGFYKISFDIALMIALFSATASLLTLTMLSMDRCFAICYPLKHKVWMTSKVVKILIGKTWVEALILPFMQIIHHEREGKEDYVVARLSSVFQTLGVAACYALIIVSGVLTIRKVRANSIQIGSLHNNQGRNNMTADLHQRNKQVAKTIAWVVALFSLFWIPITAVISTRVRRADNGDLYFWFAALGLANSSVSPWIYFYRQANYRKALRMLLGYKTNKVKAVDLKTANGVKKNTR